MTGLKGKTLVSLASIAILGGVSLGAVGVSAAESGSGETDVTVGFTDNVTPPHVDGALSLRSYPAIANFETDNNVPTGTFSKEVVYDNGAALSLWDDRPAEEGTSWSLKGQASALTAANGSTVDGSITFKHANGIKDWTGDPTTSPLPGVGGTAATTVTDAPGAATELGLDGGAVEVASTTTSAHQQGYSIPVNSTQLDLTNVNNEVAGKTYTGTVTWTLSDAE